MGHTCTWSKTKGQRIIKEKVSGNAGHGTQGERSSDQGQGTRNSEMALESLDREEVKQGGDCKTQPKSCKRNYFCSPEPDCASRPVQKITQHLQKMSPQRAAKVALKKRRAPLEAVGLKMPNPTTRSSGMRYLGLSAKKMTSPSASGQL